MAYWIVPALQPANEPIGEGVFDRIEARRVGWEVAQLGACGLDGLRASGLTGVLVASMQAKSPAEEAGFKRCDVILSVDGQTVDRPEAFGNAVPEDTA